MNESSDKEIDEMKRQMGLLKIFEITTSEDEQFILLIDTINTRYFSGSVYEYVDKSDGNMHWKELQAANDGTHRIFVEWSNVWSISELDIEVCK